MNNVKILIVDDDVNLTLLIEARLKAADYDVRAANSAGEAYRTFLTFKPQVVLTDIGIGDENGLDLVKRIRSQSETVKTIYMTGDLDRYRSALVKESNLHHADVITKPFKTDQLITLVAAQARGRQQLAEARAYESE
jgi:DNA-binding response OmpR family regulator